MAYTERRIGLHENFETYLTQCWPKGVPTDCTKLDHEKADCLDRVDPEMCVSCLTYDRLAGEFDEEQK